MKTFTQPLAAATCALLLAACGGEAPTPQAELQPQIATTTVHRTSSRSVVPSDYHDVVQRVYVAYFGRPADPGGLDFFAQAYLNAGAATNIVDFSAAYGSKPALTALLDAFGNSKESSDLYPGSNVEFITAIYSYLFNRTPDQAGLDFWVGAINGGHMTRGQAAVAIMAGSQRDDTLLITRKVAIAKAFTTSLDTDAEKTAYSGDAANVVVRNMLKTVTLGTDPVAFQATIDSTIQSLMAPSNAQLFTQVQGIVKSRCVACHSAKPTFPGYNPAPLGIKYDTPESIEADAFRIADSVASFSMPYGNFTDMTDAERATVAKWFAGRGK